MAIPYNILFTYRITRSVLGNTNPHFCAQPSQTRAVQKDW